MYVRVDGRAKPRSGSMPTRAALQQPCTDRAREAIVCASAQSRFLHGWLCEMRERECVCVCVRGECCAQVMQLMFSGWERGDRTASADKIAAHTIFDRAKRFSF